LKIERNRPSVKVTPRGYDTTGLPRRFFNAGELDVWLHLVESVSPEIVIEFGVHEGRNAAAAFRNIASIWRYVGVDVTPGYRSRMPVQRLEVPATPGRLVRSDRRFELIVRPNGTLDLVADDLPMADVVFIDADHSRVCVEHDYTLARQVLRPGGMVIFHDDNGLPQVEVTQTLNDLCERGEEIVHVADTWLSFVRP
jgi:predicted O-methyltransferase YrrM